MKRKKMFVVGAFPYPNGPLHLGHLGTFLPADFVARYYKLKGYDVLYPMGWHVTGNPVVYIALRIQKGDKKIYDMFTNIYKIPEDIVKQFTDPHKILEYFISKMKEAMQKLNLMIDWSREFKTSDIHFNKFVQWQFKKLKEKGYIIKGKYPVAWCSNENQPIGKGSAERSEGEDADIIEMSIIKFEAEYNGKKVILPVATLRPETVFGVTNLWINPDLEYWLIKVNNEYWIVVKECIIKLKDQEKFVEEIEKVDINKLLFKVATLNLDEIIINAAILPAKFVDPWKGTGIVMSVPAHDPYDYVAYKLAKEKYPEVTLPEPRKVINTPYNFDELLKDITDERDPRLEKIKDEVYKKELTCEYIFWKFAGLSTEEARQEIIEYLRNNNKWDKLYELSEKAVCRCGTVLHVKIIDQWFIDYSNREWKNLAREWLSRAKIYPEKWRSALEYAIEWVDKRPCARKTGIGTPFPFEEGWKIEPLSDSTIYMAFFTISHILKTIDPEKIADELFDYIFLGKGSSDEISKKYGIEKEKIEQMRKEFLKWYPLDINFTGQDLLNNHSTFYIFHHTAIFPKELWPKGLAISGTGRYEGQEMHKSKGTAKDVLEYVERYGADVIRLWYAYTAEYGEDFSYYEENRTFVENRLQKIKEFWEEVSKGIESNEAKRYIDYWIISEYNSVLEKYEKLFDEMKFRSISVLLIIDMYNKLKLYYEITKDNGIIKNILRRLLMLLWPITPNFVETLIGKNIHYPEKIEIKEELSPDLIYKYINNLIEDIKHAIKLFKRKNNNVNPKKLYIYVTSDRKYEILKEILEGKDVKEIIKKYNVDFKEIERIRKIIYNYNLKKYTKIDEKALINDLKEYLKKVFGLDEIIVFKYDEDKNIYDPSGKAPLSIPYKPSFWLENEGQIRC